MILYSLQFAVLLLSFVCAWFTLRAALRSRHDHLRARNAALGAVIALANAAVVILDMLEHRTGSGWIALLRLLPQATLPLLMLLLLRAARRQDAMIRAAAHDAYFNPATSLPNHALLVRQIVPALARCRRESVPAAVLIAAIDGFAELADRRGPHHANEMLHGFASILGETTRAGDLSGHVEPHVLGTLLPAATQQDALQVAGRLRALSAERLVDPEMTGERVSVSIGIAIVGDGAEPAALEEAMSAAMAAYRAAVAGGGNQVQLSEPPPARSAGLPGQLGR